MERDAWILLAAAYPEMLDEVYAWKELTTTDPEYQKLLVSDGRGLRLGSRGPAAARPRPSAASR